ncbi:MAG: hypothetical protein IIU14_08435 [Ruminococcus sp.]|nr:hypothetical protein [Ruminococcus sp.]
MSKRRTASRPAQPAPPINARRLPAAQSVGNEPQEELMVDIMAESLAEEDTAAPAPIVENEVVEDDVKIYGAEHLYEPPEEEEEVKVYIPSKKDSSEEIYSDSSLRDVSPLYEESPEEENEADESGEESRKNLGVWVTVIIALSVLCVGAAGLYAFVNGYFDSILTKFI